jgi:dihydroflavonol-4-reductase
MASVLVTGANSLLGTNVIIELLSRGYKVTGLLRDIRSFHYSGHENLRLIEADIRDMKVAGAATKNCDFVIHIAAITSQNLPRYKDYREVNAIATENLVKIAIKENIKRFIMISSSNAVGFGTKEKPGIETTKIKKPVSGSFYAMSKLEGQQLALKYSDKIDVVVLSPGFMLGAWDSKPSSGRIILMGLKRIVFYPPGGKNFIHVQDVATGIVNALTMGRNGEVYLLANENLSFREFFDKLSAVTGKPSLYIKVPGIILSFIGIFGSFLQILGIKTEITFTNMRILCTGNYYSGRKAATELGITYQSTERSIKDAIEWFRSKNMIR